MNKTPINQLQDTTCYLCVCFMCYLQGDRESDQRMTIQMTTPVAKGGFGSLVSPAAGMGAYEVSYAAPALVK
jgi:hypothetical protein